MDVDETDRARLERIAREAVEAILRDIIAEDRQKKQQQLPPIFLDVAMELLHTMLRTAGPMLKAEDYAVLAPLPEEEIRRRLREDFEPSIRRHLAPGRPN